MYHALYRGEREYADIEQTERPYAVSVEKFERQLDMLAEAGIPVLDPARLPGDLPPDGGVLLTFDDGHGSNHRHAMPLLAGRGLRAAFFVTSDFIGSRHGFCEWREIRELSGNGMLVGSHGKTHMFFDDLETSEAEAEFRHSKEAIENCISARVGQISFPGGRFLPRHIALGQSLGFDLFYSSKVGSHATRPIPQGAVLRRIPIRHDTADERFHSYVRADAAALLREQFLAEAKRNVRRVIGNRFYHYLYESLARR
jgi:peptidoglycan/xylan/chitin deacetylase (PgdA/CDA1 family)